jgi:maleate isomerase
MAKRVLLGNLTPSSNTIVEPVVCAMLSDLPDVSAHFSRFKVMQVSLDDTELNRSMIDFEPILEAAQLLADAQVDVIVWNGTSGGWMGLDVDQRLCARITTKTGIPATTSVLALKEIFLKTGVKKYGLVSPYLHEVQAKIVDNLNQEGFTCVAERHLNDRGNFSYSEVTETTISNMVRQVAKANPDAITILCTNVKGAPTVEPLESELNIPIYDSIATAVWKSLLIANVNPQRVRGWGRLFHEVR